MLAKRKFPTKEEYFDLIDEYKAAVALRDTLSTKLAAAKSEKKQVKLREKLSAAKKEASKLGDNLISNVEPLIRKFARMMFKYAKRMSLEEFEQAGRIAAMNALRTWNSKLARECSLHFTTHASYWIKAEMFRIIKKEDCGSVRLPLNNSKSSEEKKTERITCISLDSLSGWLRDNERTDDTHDLERQLYKLGAYHHPEAEDETEDRERAERLSEATQKIPKERDRQIFLRRLEGETLESIAQDYGFSRERIRQIWVASIRVIDKAVNKEQLSA